MVSPVIGSHSPSNFLSRSEIAQLLHLGIGGRFTNRRVVVLIPDQTRSLPLAMLFRHLVDVLDDTRQLDFMVALGTHAPLSEADLQRLVGITDEERRTRYASIGLLSHAWNDPSALKTIGTITKAEVKQIAGDQWHPSLGGDIPIRINAALLDYDQIVILGPTFPHEVVGFSGGAKYLFPGVSGPEMINATHWLGALAGVLNTIGIKETPVRAMIHAAAEHVPRPITLIALVVTGENVDGMFIGDHIRAWQSAADLSAVRHILWKEKPFRRVLSCAPPMYDDLWTAAKAVYKLAPVVAEGGEVVIFAPHLDTVSRVHGEHIFEIGYHVLPYFLQEWDRYADVPLCVLAHSTHVCGSGVMDHGVEKPRFKVTLSSQIPPEDCSRLCLGYLDPESVDIDQWMDRESEGLLVVPKAGETLYRLR